MSRQSSGTNITHYMLSDHEGSIAAITDGSAATTVSESFSAFGARRNPSSWSGTPACPDLCMIASISREGYIKHDALGGVSMGLNHMNGRVQDAITGRFLSPDPYVQDPGNTQSFNRYSYANNNPLTLTDPTGFDYCQPASGGGSSADVQPLPCTPADPDHGFAGDPGAGDGSSDSQLPDTGCGIPPYGSCYSNSQIPAAPYRAPPVAPVPPSIGGGGGRVTLPPPDPGLAKCLKSILYCNSPQKSPPAQSHPAESLCENVGELVAGTLAGAAAGAAGGAVAGTEIAPGVGSGALAAAGAVGGAVTGLVTSAISVGGAPAAFTGAVGVSTGYVTSAFAGEALAGGATLEGALAGAGGGALSGLPGVLGAAVGGAVGAYVPAAGIAVAAPIVAGGIAGGATYLAVKAVAASICGP